MPGHDIGDPAQHHPLEGQLGQGQPGRAAGQFGPGEPDVPGLLQNVDLVHHLDDRLDRVVGGHLPLVAVGDFLADQDGAPHGGPVGGGGQQPSKCVDVAGRAVVRHAHPLDQAGEHRGVPALLGHLGERVLHVPGGRVLLVGQLRQQAHQDALQPDAEAGHAGGLVPAEFAPLLRGEPVPQRRPVQGGAVLGQEDLARLRRRGPVDVEFRVVGPGRGRAQQAVGDPLLVRAARALAGHARVLAAGGPAGQLAGLRHRFRLQPICNLK